MKAKIYTVIIILIIIPIAIGSILYHHYDKIRKENIAIQSKYADLWGTIPNDELIRFEYADYSQVNERKLFLAISAYNSYNDKDLTLEDFKKFLSEEYNEDGSLRIDNVPKKIQDYGDWYNEIGKTVKTAEYSKKLEKIYFDFYKKNPELKVGYLSLDIEQLKQLVEKESNPSYEIDVSLWE